MTRVHVRALLCTLFLAAFSQQAFAHFIWVVTGRTAENEPTVQVYFGEMPKAGDPDLISYIEDVELMMLDASGMPVAIALEKGESSMIGHADLGDRIVMGSRDLGEMERGGTKFELKYHFKAGPHYASDAWASTNSQEHLPLDVIPERAPNGDLVLNVSWQGEALPGAEIVVSRLDAPPTKGTSGDDGTFTVADPEPGFFGVRVKHAPEEPTAELPARHYTTVTFEVLPVSPIAMAHGPDYPLTVSSHGAAFGGGSLYVYGGHTGVTHSYSTETTTGRFFRWTPNRFGANEWEELASGVHVQGMGLVAYRGALYRIGGARPRNAPGEKHDIRSIATCSVFRPETGEWEAFRDLPAPRSSFDTIVWNDTLIVTGGWEMHGEHESPVWSDTTLMLDLSDPDAEWRSVAQPWVRRALGCSVVDDKLYVVGGLTAEGEVERLVEVLDLETLEWSSGPDLPGTRMNGFTPAICNFNGRLLASPSDGKIYRLAEDGGSWDLIGELAHDRFVHRMVPIDGRTVAVIGGASREGNRTSVELVEFRDSAGAMDAMAIEASAPIGLARPTTAGKQERCPVMQSDFVFEDSEVVSYNGIEVLVCCESCEKKWKTEPEAYLDLALLPQLQGEEIPTRKIEQVYCPVFIDRVVSSQDPSLEHEGRTLYFFNESARKRFLEDPSRYPVTDELFHWEAAAGSH